MTTAGGEFPRLLYFPKWHFCGTFTAERRHFAALFLCENPGMEVVKKMAYDQSFNGFGQMQGMGQRQMYTGPMQQMPMQQMQTQQMLMQQAACAACRLVSCEDEVRACPADLSGAPSIFFNPMARVFYLKELDTMTGRTRVETYGRVQPEQEPPDELTSQLLERVQRLEEKIAESQTTTGKGRKAAAQDE